MSQVHRERLFSWTNRNLLAELFRVKLKVTDHDSILGMFWSLIGPLMLLLAMFLIFRQRFGQQVYAYPLYLFLGISCVSFFINSTSSMIRILITNRDLLLHSTLRWEIIILAELFIYTYKFIIELAICCALSIFYGTFSWKGALLFLPVFLGYLALVLGIGLIGSLVYCFSRDIEHIWILVSRLLFFVTPVFFTLDKISPFARKFVYWVNPLSPFIISFHGIFMNRGNVNVFTYLYSLLLAVFYFGLGYFVFIIFENKGITDRI
jgi:ABC-type polysaccharide/polyol phosphate export permease